MGIKTIEELFCDESFLKRLVEAKTRDEVKSFLKRKARK